MSEQNVIYKVGDNLLCDMNVQILFWILNVIWASSSMTKKPFVRQYRVLPTGENEGFIEFVNSNTIDSFDWSSLANADKEQKEKFILSVAGGFLAIFVLGIRDRHRDNMLITDDLEYLHIDFGHIFNKKPMIDANRLAIPIEIKQTLTKEEWDFLMEVFTDGFLLLRRNMGMIQYFCATIFSFLCREDVICQHIYESFFPTLSEKDACTSIRNLIESGLFSLKKKNDQRFLS